MRLSDKNKKQKAPISKTPLVTQTKKIQTKKLPIKKQEILTKKTLSSANLTKATNTGLSSGTQTSKYSIQTMKCSPKASLSQIKQINGQKPFSKPKPQQKAHQALKQKVYCQQKQKIQSLSYVPYESLSYIPYESKSYLPQNEKAQKQVQKHIKNKNISISTTSLHSKATTIMVDKAKQQIKKSLANVIKSYYPEKKTCLDISMTQVTKDATQKQDKMAPSEFGFVEIIGEGGYGKVWKVQLLKTRKQYAMKQMSKAAIIMKKSVDNVLNQRKILQKLRNDFIANIQFAFNDRDNLYLVMDLLAGGDLRYHIGRINKFTQDQSKFLIGCIIVAIQYIHRMKIFHRDIKPQNLVFDEFGYLKLTDFGIARIDSPTQNLDASGTPGYMAPQVLCKQVHSYPVDFYALGIIAYELILGKRPYHGNNRIQIRDAILSKQHTMKKSELPVGFKPDVIDLVNKLIFRQPANRLGSKQGIKQLKTHPWFKGFNWNDLADRKMKSPFKGKFTMEIQEKLNDQEEALMQYKLLQRSDEKMDPFAKYYFHLGEK